MFSIALFVSLSTKTTYESLLSLTGVRRLYSKSYPGLLRPTFYQGQNDVGDGHDPTHCLF